MTVMTYPPIVERQPDEGRYTQCNQYFGHIEVTHIYPLLAPFRSIRPTRTVVNGIRTIVSKRSDEPRPGQCTLSTERLQHDRGGRGFNRRGIGNMGLEPQKRFLDVSIGEARGAIADKDNREKNR
jgi:hypothetical protein